MWVDDKTLRYKADRSAARQDGGNFAMEFARLRACPKPRDKNHFNLEINSLKTIVLWKHLILYVIKNQFNLEIDSLKAVVWCKIFNMVLHQTVKDNILMIFKNLIYLPLNERKNTIFHNKHYIWNKTMFTILVVTYKGTFVYRNVCI